MHSPLNRLQFRPAPAVAANGPEGWPGLSIASLPLRTCRNPRVAPAPVQQCSVVFDPLDVCSASFGWSWVAGVYDLGEATPTRQFEFLAGRACVAEAMGALGLPGQPPPRRRSNGTPAWPGGLTGSITHTRGFVSAAVVSTRDVTAIGIDSEEILSAERATRVADVFATSGEIAAARAAGLDAETAITLIFSAKEAIFKCLHAQVRRVFDFHDAQITEVNDDRGGFTATIVPTLSPLYPAGSTLEGRFDVDRHRVHTGMLIATLARE